MKKLTKDGWVTALQAVLTFLLVGYSVITPVGKDLPAVPATAVPLRAAVTEAPVDIPDGRTVTDLQQSLLPGGFP